MKYHKALQIIRAATGISQQELSEKAGISKSLLSRIESGERSLSDKNKKIIANTLRLPESLINLLAQESTKLSKKEIANIGFNLVKIMHEPHSSQIPTR